MNLKEELLKLEQIHQQLKIDFKILKLAYLKLKKSRQSDKALIKSLKLEIKQMKNQSATNRVSMSPLKTYKLNLFSLDKNPLSKSCIKSSAQNTGKTPQPNPDQSIQSDQSSSYIYQGFLD